MLQIAVEGANALAVLRSFDKQLRFATAAALNNVAFTARTDVQAEMRKVFDRPTPYILSALRVTKKADKTDLSATLEPQSQGGKGVDPANILRPEVAGGARKLKRAEVSL